MIKNLISIVCDDIRTEVGKKLSLIGIFDQAILVAAFPHFFPKLCLFQKWEGLKDAKEMKIELSGEGITPLTMEMKMDPKHAKKTGRTNIVVSFVALEIPKSTILKFKTYFDEKPQPAHELEISVEESKDFKKLME